MARLAFRSPSKDDVALLSNALASLARDLGDPFLASETSLRQALFGPCPSARARLAERGNRVVGVVLFSPVYSTAQGGAGVYVSDVWVASDLRGENIGRDLLRDAAQRGAELWDARFMRLVVHDDNARAALFYSRLGFAPIDGQSTLALTGLGFQTLGDRYESDS
ncbi:GNAT family N-acetyltransferase [Marivita geojedonensis]|uniref:N-acetyltransferase domain-containing protein n=1 Tax=Marivita geojedonensis TaxID=1123756 RepID=A0A1X4NLB0_9RHOB|nr:GNAT family N-acetyltransferase [Marivita geojedonensis]OSQ51072.1 hypothetical protein MGEO_10155 [Marivita geojedonensis]